MAVLSKLVPEQVDSMTSVVMPSWMVRGLDDDVPVAVMLAWIVFKSKGTPLRAEQSEHAITKATGLSQKQQRRARDVLFDAGILGRVHSRGRRMVFEVSIERLRDVQERGTRLWLDVRDEDEPG